MPPAAVRVRWHPEDPLRALRDRIQPSTMARSPWDVLLELNNDELLITDYALDEIAD